MSASTIARPPWPLRPNLPQQGERFNAYSHLLGLALAIAGAMYLMHEVWPRGDANRILAALIFSASTVAMYVASYLFHCASGHRRHFWQIADHCAIHLLIAGTFTPLAIVKLPGTTGIAVLCLMWAAAAVGISRELRAAADLQPSLVLYVGMGWLGTAALLSSHWEGVALTLLLGGALLYTVGTLFYRNRRGLRHAHGIWHLFVLGGTVSHYLVVARLVL